MKNMKKLLSVALILVLALALCAPALAVDEPEVADITINIEVPAGTTAPAEKYTVYKIFSASVGTETTGQDITNPTGTGSTFENVAYTIENTSPFFSTVESFKEGTVFDLKKTPDNTTTYVVTLKDGATYDAADLATALKAVIDSDVDTSSVRVVNDQPSGFTVENTGYYLILSSLGSKMVVDTIGQGDMSIKTKNELPTLDKKIKAIEDGTVAEGSKSGTAAYGKTVTFAIEVAVPATAVGSMTVHDEMNENLTYVGLAEGAPATEVETKAHTACTKEFLISAETVAANLGQTVTIEYTATLKDGAPVDTAIGNTAYLTYSEYTTPKSEVEVYTYEFDLVKTTSDYTVLPGAKFTLYKVVGENDVLLRENIEVGTATISGLASGSYKLIETEAPKGYNKLTTPVEFTIENASLKATIAGEGENRTWTSGGVQVTNLTGAELPSTGGIGTTIFYIVGGLLVVAAGVVLVARKRVNDK